MWAPSPLPLAIGSTMLFGLIPALQVSRPSVNESLQQGVKGSTGGLQTNRLRALLVISQVSLSLLLLTGAGLLIKSFFNLRATNPGFDPQRLMTLQVSLPRVRYPELDQQIRAFDAIMEKISAIPGVESAGGANPLPLGGSSVAKIVYGQWRSTTVPRRPSQRQLPCRQAGLLPGDENSALARTCLYSRRHEGVALGRHDQ